MDQNNPTTQPTEPTEQTPPVVQAETLETAQEFQITTGTAEDPPTDPSADTTILPALVDDPLADNLNLESSTAPPVDQIEQSSPEVVTPENSQAAPVMVSLNSLEPLTNASDETPAALVQIVSLSIDSNAAELGLPPGTIRRSTSLLISADDPPGYTPTDLHVALTPRAQVGLRRLAAGRAAHDQCDVDHIATVRELLESFAD